MKCLLSTLFLLLNFYLCIAQWTPLNGPATAAAHFSTGRQQIFAGTTDGMFRSEDLGVSWVRITDLPQAYYYHAVKISPDSAQLVVDAYDNKCRCPYLFRSTDDGKSWQKINLPGFAEYVVSLYAGHQDYLLISVQRRVGEGAENTIWESFDGGKIWQKNALENQFDGIKWDFRFFENHIWGLTETQLFRGSVNGKDWKLVADKLDTLETFSYAVIENVILLHTTRLQRANLWRSTTDGLSWHLVSNAPGIVQNIQQHNNILLAFNGLGVIRSDDKGLTWAKQTADSLKLDKNFLLRWPYVIGYLDEKGVARSSDAGKNFTVSDERLGYASFAERLLYFDDQLYCSNPRGTSERIMRYADEAGQWSSVPINLNPYLPLHDFDHDLIQLDGRIFCSTLFFNRVIRSEDAGNTWIECSEFNHPDGLKISGNKLFSIGNSLFTFGSYNSWYRTLLRTDDYGEHWKLVNPAPPTECSYSGVSLAGHVGDKLFAGLKYGDCLFASDDLGETWSTVQLPVIPLETDTGRTYLISMTPTGKRILLTMGRWEKGQEDYFFYASNNEGVNWETCEMPRLWSIQAFFNYPTSTMESGNYVLQTFYNDGVLFSVDKGVSWDFFNEGLPSIYVSDIEMDDAYLYVAVAGHGVWRRPLTDLGNFNAPGMTSLNVSVQPNPSRGLVRFVASEPIEYAHLKLFDVNGRLCFEQTVDFLCEQAVVTFPFPSGMYTFQLSSGSRQASGKLLLIR